MTAFLQLVVFMFAAVNPVAAAGGIRPRGSAISPTAVAAGALAALLVVGGAALLSNPILDGLGVEPETFRVGAGVVFLVGGALEVWRGGAPLAGAPDSEHRSAFLVVLLALVTPAALAGAVTYGADRGEFETIAAAATVFAIAAVAIGARLGRFEAAAGAVARITGGLLVVVAAGLIVSGVRAI